MKFIFSVLSVLLVSQLSQAKVVCFVTTPSNPENENIYDKVLVRFEMSEEIGFNGRRGFVPKDRSSGRELTEAEIDQIVNSGDFSSLDGGTIFNFTHPLESGYQVVVTQIDAKLPVGKMEKLMATGDVKSTYGMGVTLFGKKLWASCRQSEPAK